MLVKLTTLTVLVLLVALTAHTMGEVEEATIARVGHQEGEGLYTCLRLPGGHTPDPDLTFTTTFVFTNLALQIVCPGDLHPEPDTTGEGIIHCSMPCASTQPYYLMDFSIFVDARDATDSSVLLAFSNGLRFQSVVVVSSQRGASVVEAAWTPQPNTTYQVQLWLESQQKATTLPLVDVPSGEKSPHRGAVSGSWKQEPGAPWVLETSGVVSCPQQQCHYYFTGVQAAATYASEVIDVSQLVQYSFRTSKHLLQSHWQSIYIWSGVKIEGVEIESVGEGPAGARPKIMTVTVAAEKGADEETEDGADDGYTALVLNGHDRSQALESSPGDCLPLSSGCVVRGLESLQDPDNGGLATDLQLLLTQDDLTLSSLVSVADVLVEVREAGRGTVTVVWQETNAASVFTVSLLPQMGAPPPPATVHCAQTGTECEATFSDLVNGTYLATVSYEGEVPTSVTTQFTVEDGDVNNVCSLPFQDIGGACLMVETLGSGTWAEMNNFCHQVGGQLVKIDGGDAFFSIVTFIIDNGLNHHTYWIGATDFQAEDDFRWLDGSVVNRGTPFWAYSNGVQEPSGGSNSNCVILDKNSFFYFDDVSCDAIHTAICEEVF
nr:uncharacterized protein LOC123755283 isoform X1 [Procambarus clarkii]